MTEGEQMSETKLRTSKNDLMQSEIKAVRKLLPSRVISLIFYYYCCLNGTVMWVARVKIVG